MSNYVKAVNFATKDGLLTGDPLKIVSGTEINDEYNAIQVAVNSKANSNSPVLTGNPTTPTATLGTNTTQIASTAFVTAADTAQGVTLTAAYIAADVLVTDAFELADGTLQTNIDNITFTQASSGEITAGTETDIRDHSPADIVSYIDQHTLGGIGDGQSWTDVSGSRSLGTTYTNSTGRTITVLVSGIGSPTGGVLNFQNDSTLVATQGTNALANGTSQATFCIPIPDGETYGAFVGATMTLIRWWELR